MNKWLENKIEEHNKQVIIELEESVNGCVVNISSLLSNKEKLIHLLESKQNKINL